MDKLFDLVRRSRVFPILGAGGVGFLFQLGIFELFAVYLQILSPSIATIIGAEVGIIINFFINDRISFGDRLHKLPLAQRFLRHQGVVLGAVFVQWLCVFTAEGLTNDWLLIHAALLGGIGLGFIWNYLWYHLYVWRRHAVPTE